jgi:fucose permease
MALPALGLAGLWLRYRKLPLPAPAGSAQARAAGGGRGRLPLACWVLLVLVALGVAVEFCLVYFGAELLTSAGLRTSSAAAAMSLFYLGILAGRVGGAWLTRRPGRGVPVLWASLAVTAAGFGVFWLSGRPAVMVAGLFACGAGVANLYPLSLAITLAAAHAGGEDTANARTQLLNGAFVVVAPYLLGSVADQVGLHAAFGIMPVLIGLCALLLPAGLRLQRRRPGAGEAR